MSRHVLISTRTPLTGSDGERDSRRDGAPVFQPALPLRGVTYVFGGATFDNKFQPALPLRGVTAKKEGCPLIHVISTRTPLTGSDTSSRSSARSTANFNPHSPYGE